MSNCRCAFEKVDEVAEDAGYDPGQPRDERGMWSVGSTVPPAHETPLSTAVKASADLWDYKPGRGMRGWLFPDGSAKEFDVMGDDNHHAVVQRAAGAQLDDVMREGTGRLWVGGGDRWDGEGWFEGTPSSLHYDSLRAPTTAQVNKLWRLVNGMRMTKVYLDAQGEGYEAGPSRHSNWIEQDRPVSREQLDRLVVETWPELKRRAHDAAFDGEGLICIDGVEMTFEDYNKKHEPEGAPGGKGGQFASSEGGDDDDDEEPEKTKYDPKWERLPQSENIERRDLDSEGKPIERKDDDEKTEKEKSPSSKEGDIGFFSGFGTTVGKTAAEIEAMKARLRKAQGLKEKQQQRGKKPEKKREDGDKGEGKSGGGSKSHSSSLGGGSGGGGGASRFKSTSETAGLEQMIAEMEDKPSLTKTEAKTLETLKKQLAKMRSKS